MNKIYFYLNKYKKLLILCLIVVFCLALIYWLFGYGSINVTNPLKQTSVISDDIYQGSGSEKIKLRPGRHLVVVSSPGYQIQQELNVALFSSNNIDAQKEARDFNSTVAQALSQNTNNISVSDGKIIDDTWYGGIVFVKDTGTSNFIVMEFIQGLWHVVYLGAGTKDDAQYQTLVPTSVKQYFDQIGASKIYGD